MNKEAYIWAENLPEDCPPQEAFAPQEQVFYRLGNNPPVEYDFDSHRKRQPDTFFKVSECQARSLSVLDTLESAEAFRKLPALRNKNLAIIKMVLNESDGLVLQTGNNKNHFSWWKSAKFVLQNFEIL